MTGVVWSSHTLFNVHSIPTHSLSVKHSAWHSANDGPFSLAIIEPPLLVAVRQYPAPTLCITAVGTIIGTASTGAAAAAVLAALHSASTTRMFRLFSVHLLENNAASMVQLRLPAHTFVMLMLPSKRHEFGVDVALMSEVTLYCPQLPCM